MLTLEEILGIKTTNTKFNTLNVHKIPTLWIKPQLAVSCPEQHLTINEEFLVSNLTFLLLKNTEYFY